MGKLSVIGALLLCAIVILWYNYSEIDTTKPLPLEKLEMSDWEKRNYEMSFPKEYIDVKEVQKYHKLHSDIEVSAYFCRYNQSAAQNHYKDAKKASEYLKKFRYYKTSLGEKRYLEIMNLADKDYPF